MSPMLTIAKREFRSNFDSPLAYVVICMSFFALGLMFFFLKGGFWQVDRATVQRLFEFTPLGLSALVVPVVTMRLVAEERRSGTLEMLITLPVKDSDVIGGKYLGALGLVMILIASTLVYPIAMFAFPWKLGAVDWGPIQAGYLGMILASAAATGIGLLISSVTRSQVIAFFITFTVLLALVGSGTTLAGDLANKAGIGTVITYLSFQSHMNNFARGLIDTRAIVYFLSITVFSLMVAFRALESRKWK